MSNPSKIIGVIPARYASSRFPGKPLAFIGNKPMIQWVYEGCEGYFNRLIVATDDKRIMDAVSGFQGEAMMTSDKHQTGTERCAEVLQNVIAEGKGVPEIVVNIQGDEPLINHTQISSLLKGITEGESDIATLANPVQGDDGAGAGNPNVVKVVTGMDQRALYFSRSDIPFYRGKGTGKKYLHHIGLYAFRAEVLLKLVKLPPSPLEMAESLEQLRWLEHGYHISVKLSDQKNLGIDTPEDLKKLEKILGIDPG